jgi:hypothetical protein
MASTRSVFDVSSLVIIESVTKSVFGNSNRFLTPSRKGLENQRDHRESRVSMFPVVKKLV